jgi:transposase
MPKRVPAVGPKDVASEHESGLSGASLESVPPKKRRQFSASERLRLVKAADAAVATGKRGALGTLLRKEGIYSSHLTKWRTQLKDKGAAGLGPQKPGRKPKLDERERQLLLVTKELAQVLDGLRHHRPL